MTIELEVMEADHPRYLLKVVGGADSAWMVIPSATCSVGEILTVESSEVQRERPEWLASFN